MIKIGYNFHENGLLKEQKKLNVSKIEEIVKATIEAMDAIGGERGFFESMKRFNLDQEKLELWITAYEEGGISGIRALIETFSLEQKTALEATAQIASFFQVVWPLCKYRIYRRKNRISVKIIFPGEEDFWDLFQVRYTPFDDRWHLYWKRNNESWCPYVSDWEHTDGVLWKLLYLVYLDHYGCFLL